ncbi:MAG: hypothetical protein CMJ32_09880 [Phycisphaerae bacterium]|nr:hypothetical protein [Phycisphaerae bacterium]
MNRASDIRLGYHVDMADSISIDFGRPISLFPLPGVVLLPHTVQALHIFEPRYRQMVEDCLAVMDGDDYMTADHIAIASLEPKLQDGSSANHQQPPLKPAVCIGQIIQHEPIAGGRHNILLQGVCRARIDSIDEPEHDRLYRQAYLKPIGAPHVAAPPMLQVREEIRSALTCSCLHRLQSARTIVNWLDREDLPTHAIIELASFLLIKDETARYGFLEEGDPVHRASMLQDELDNLHRLVQLAEQQGSSDWPKGLSWN